MKENIAIRPLRIEKLTTKRAETQKCLAVKCLLVMNCNGMAVVDIIDILAAMVLTRHHHRAA